jgi:cell division protein FtsL
MMNDTRTLGTPRTGHARVRKSRQGRRALEQHEHGWARATDPVAAPLRSTAPKSGRRAPAGTSFLLAVAVCVMAAIGIVRVHASNEVLEIGARITELTQEQAHLLEEKRRLAAERAYLRHPEQIEDIARNKLGLVPITPELVQPIRLVSERSSVAAKEESP